jgi:acyl carrier protein
MGDAFIPQADITDGEILAVLARVVGESLRIDPARVTMDTTLTALGAESIDLVEITMDLEHAFSVLMPERTVLQIATEIAGEGTVERDGVLTHLGSELLRARMPEIDPHEIAAGRPVKELSSFFLRVDVWVRVIRGLLEATPRACARCGSRIVQGSPGQVKCPACGLVIDVPSGDAIAREWAGRWLATRAS